uniref:Uncharacterized protein n=1 Tax=Meloidogyne javanica TaxID=6303 RepID=A0A915MUX2_MELJA
ASELLLSFPDAAAAEVSIVFLCYHHELFASIL